ncbi:CDP-glucose 4,6-dehydratase [Acetobacter okinawensis]|uniref:CDP-glucose 4,6-dehydratase n=1 Tax=Acetobacter okinawensis TaxID=1076594 RepID=UPI001BABE39B|nr:CDP-glucose 4,6-dehydratase [Acetobacter okinawensis]MBS0964977.1 CDP-glucose 4,6-dehydratase [Acetobacter okinawensis]
MEDMVSRFAVDKRFWSGRKVFVTGHTGFKGSWLTQWLADLGAQVTGYALAPDTQPNLFGLAQLDKVCRHTIGDIRHLEDVQCALASSAPEVVIHLAAQPLVRRSYQQPLETFSTNVMGTANILEAARQQASVKAVLIISSDKCYDNREWSYGYRENDALGGHDPYSASKACTEIVTNAWRSSYAHGPLVASARAGNVFGGGDWSEDRLLPDAIKAFSAGETLIIRSPLAERPWQHVAEPLAAYLMIVRAMLEEGALYARAWNVGPRVEDIVSVEQIVKMLAQAWGHGARWEVRAPAVMLHEAGLLHLDSSQIARLVGWRPSGLLEQALNATVAWRAATTTEDAVQLMRKDRAVFARANIACSEPA